MARVKKHPHSGHNGPVRDFIKVISELSKNGKRHAEVLDDFLELAYCAHAKLPYALHDREHPRAVALEDRYMKCAAKCDAKYIARMPELLGILTEALESGGEDFLGKVSGELGALSEHLAQFFTPYHLSRVVAELTLGGVPELIADKGYFTIDEPAAGAGGMLIAVADVLQEQGFDPMVVMRARATDLSSTAYRMAFLQLTLRGIPAEVFHGNTITLEVFESAYTPPWLVHHAHHRQAAAVRKVLDAVRSLQAEQAVPEGETASAAAEAPAPPPPSDVKIPSPAEQLALFKESA